MTDPHATTISTCSRGHTFEDLAVAVEENGGWCPECDGPAWPRVEEIRLPLRPRPLLRLTDHDEREAQD